MKRLEIGCGHKPTPGVVRVDANPLVDADWHGDAVGPMPWADGEFDEIGATDVLEHIPFRLTSKALAEWARLLKPGGKLYVQVPDCGRIMREYVENPSRWRERLPADLSSLPPILGVTWRVLGGQDEGNFTTGHGGGYTTTGDPAWWLNVHLAMFDEPSLRWYLEQAGFYVVSMESNFHPNLCCWAERR